MRVTTVSMGEEPAATRKHAISTLVPSFPSLLSVMSKEVGPAFSFWTSSGNGDGKRRASNHPMRFAVSLRAPTGDARRWRFIQGGDPLIYPTARSFVCDRMQPIVVVRLSAWVTASAATASSSSRKKFTQTARQPDAESLAGLYGARAADVIHVPNFFPRHIKDESEETIVLVSAVVRHVWEALLVALERHMSNTGNLTVYVHCAEGKERSRFVMTLLHGLFFLNAPLEGDSVLSLVKLWCERQARVHMQSLSLRHLLCHHRAVSMFAVLAKVLSHILGFVKNYALIGKVLAGAEKKRPTRGTGFDCCAARAACTGSRRDGVTVMCLKCHMAFFCSLECTVASEHWKKKHCCKVFDADTDAPVLLRASPLDNYFNFAKKSQKKRRRKSSSTSSSSSSSSGSGNDRSDTSGGSDGDTRRDTVDMRKISTSAKQ